MLLAIDPGPERSAYVLYADGAPTACGILDNDDLLSGIKHEKLATALAVEMIASYGMPVGAEVFGTCVWIGRFVQRWNDTHGLGASVELVTRQSVKLHLCGSARAKDANVRQALIDRYGPGKEKAVGKKASPGPLYGVTSHVWSALAVAVTAADTMAGEREAA